MRFESKSLAPLLAALFAFAIGCATAPDTRPEQRSLEAQADAVIASMTREDPTLGTLLATAPGYVVFPEIGEAGFIAGGSAGVGVVYENDRPVGYVELREGSVGAQMGGQTFAQLVVFRTDDALERLKSNNFDGHVEAGATLIRSGAAASAPFEDGTAVFVDDEAGLMLEASVGGQSLTYVPG